MALCLGSTHAGVGTLGCHVSRQVKAVDHLILPTYTNFGTGTCLNMRWDATCATKYGQAGRLLLPTYYTLSTHTDLSWYREYGDYDTGLPREPPSQSG